jgi:ABC-type transport system involved in multi-copper enzyme maturation permease subunit
MRIRVWWALARAVVLESVRRKDLWVVAILGFLILISAGALGFFGFQGLQTFAKDLATTVLGLFSTIVGVLVATRLLPEEIRHRTLYPLLARPISRFDLLLGKWLGAVLVTWIAFLLLCALTAVALTTFRVEFEAIMAQYVVAKMMGLALLCSVSLTLSVFMTPNAAATLAFVLAFGSGMMIRALTMAYETAPPAMQAVFPWLNALVPQLGLFDLGGRAANAGWGLAPAWVMGFLLVYLIAYGGAMLGLAWARFRRQAI